MASYELVKFQQEVGSDIKVVLPNKENCAKLPNSLCGIEAKHVTDRALTPPNLLPHMPLVKRYCTTAMGKLTINLVQ